MDADPSGFLGLTALLFGAAAALTDNALARNWRSAWLCALPLGVGDRVLLHALFDGWLLSAASYRQATSQKLIGRAVACYDQKKESYVPRASTLDAAARPGFRRISTRGAETS